MKDRLAKITKSQNADESNIKILSNLTFQMSRPEFINVNFLEKLTK